MQNKNRNKSSTKKRTHISSVVIVVLLFHPGLHLKYQHSVDLEKSQFQQELTIYLMEEKGL